MSMGPSSGSVRPVRRSSYTPRVSTSTEEGAAATAERTAPTEEVHQEYQAAPANPELPTYVAVGGGLSNRRIVTKLPQDLQGETPAESILVKIVKYVISPEVATSDSDRTIVEDVRERIEMPDSRLLINNPPGLGQSYNLGREHLQDKLGLYLVAKAQRTGSGDVSVNFADIAIVTHDEGGHSKHYRALEERI